MSPASTRSCARGTPSGRRRCSCGQTATSTTRRGSCTSSTSRRSCWATSTAARGTRAKGWRHDLAQLAAAADGDPHHGRAPRGAHGPARAGGSPSRLVLRPAGDRPLHRTADGGLQPGNRQLRRSRRLRPQPRRRRLAQSGAWTDRSRARRAARARPRERNDPARLDAERQPQPLARDEALRDARHRTRGGRGVQPPLHLLRRPLDRVYGPFDNFGFEGVVPLAYVVFALALTFVVGVLWRRTAPAVIVGFAAYVGARLFVQDWLRQRFAAPLSATWAPHASGPRLDRAWVLAQVPSDKAGHPFTGGAAVLQTCARSFGKGVKGLDPHCLMRHGAGYNHAVWQPASRFWEFQGIETALFGGVALLLLAFASLWLRHRAA